MRPCRQLLRLLSLAVALQLVLPRPLALARGSGENPVASAERAKGTVALNLGRYDEAVEHLSQAYTMTQDPMLLYSLGQAYRLAGKPEKALASYSSFLRAAGSTPKYRTQLERAAAEIETITSFVLNRPVDRAGQDKQLDNLMTAPGPVAARDLAPPPMQADKVAESAPAAVEPPPLALTPPPVPPSPPPGLSLSSQTNTPAQAPPSRIYKKWWFWTSVAVALAAGGTAAWWFTRPENQVPTSSYGAIRVLQ